MNQRSSLSNFTRYTVLKAWLNLKSEAATSNLNYLWWVLEPALFIAVYYLIFGIFFNNKTDGFVAFLVCGKIPFIWFSRTVSNSVSSIYQGLNEEGQVKIPSVVFPIVVILQDAVKFMAVLLVMLATLLLLQIEPTMKWIQIIPLLLTQFLFISFLSFAFSGLMPFFVDIKYIANTFVILMMFASGIFYDPSRFILPEHRDLFFLNPLAFLIDSYRNLLLYDEAINWSWYAIMTSVIVVLLCITVKLTMMFDKKYSKLVKE